MKQASALIAPALAMLLAACATHAPAPSAATSHLDGNTITVGDPHADPTDQAQLAKVQEALAMMQQGQVQQAIDGPLNAVIEHYEHAWKDKHTIVFSARNSVQSLLYLSTVAAEQDKGKLPARHAIVLGPAWAMAHWAKGYAYDALHDYAHARVELKAALALSPMDSQYTSELAYTWLKVGDWDQALKLYKDAEAYGEFASGDSAVRLKCVALRGQGYALVELHRLDAAVKAYEDCLKLDPGDTKSKGELRYISRLRQRPAQQ